MGISDRLLGRKNVNGRPHIDAVVPPSALPGGEIRIIGSGLKPPDLQRPRVAIDEVEAPIVISSEDFVVARIPEGAHSGNITVANDGMRSNAMPINVAIPIADNLHPVTNPAIDHEGNIYA